MRSHRFPLSRAPGGEGPPLELRRQVAGGRPVDAGHAAWWTARTIVVVGSISLVGLGILSGIMPLLYPERGEQMSLMVQAVVLLISGVYHAVNVLRGWLQAVSHRSPATYLFRGIRGATINGPGFRPQGANLGILGLFGLVMVPGSLLAFDAAGRRANQTGPLKRQG